jgi:uncharacterized membrane protein HdeD (DUF308 family)
VNKEHSVIDKRDYLDVFATTGHEALKALLLVSGGSVVAFLAFLGTLLSNAHLAEAFGRESIVKFLLAMAAFLLSVVFCLLTFAASFWSHACYYEQRRQLGRQWTVIGGILGIACIVWFLVGGSLALWGLWTSKASL